MSSTVRTGLTITVAILGYLAASDPFGLPAWVQGVVAVALVGLAAVGIVPPTLTKRTGDAARALAPANTVYVKRRKRSSWGKSRV